MSGREYLNKIIFGKDGYVSRVLEILGRQFQIDSEDLRGYTIKEVIGLFQGLSLDKKIIKSRTKAFVVMGFGSRNHYIEGREAKAIIFEFSKMQKSTDQVTGVVANKGFAQGRVKLLPPNYVYDSKILSRLLKEVRKGDILVAETTSPELMPACKIAGAIITNQGGMLSHAAIVSRELGIPCIIGTENATEILKDGDMVEVDAERGIVKKL